MKAFQVFQVCGISRIFCGEFDSLEDATIFANLTAKSEPRWQVIVCGVRVRIGKLDD